MGLDDDTTVLITAAHGGHYGKPKHPDEESASVALQALRDLQTQMKFWHADKCVVGGDFNEIGNLIEWYPDQFHPLPQSTKNQIQPHPGKTHPYEKHSDHIWAGGKDVGDAEARVGDAYGSDHCCVIMIGI